MTDSPMTTEPTAPAASTTDAPTAPEAAPTSKKHRPAQGGNASGGTVYGLGMIGALVYFFSTASDRRDYAMAIPKSLAWPAILVYRLLGSTNASSDS